MIPETVDLHVPVSEAGALTNSVVSGSCTHPVTITPGAVFRLLTANSCRSLSLRTVGAFVHSELVFFGENLEHHEVTDYMERLVRQNYSAICGCRFLPSSLQLKSEPGLFPALGRVGPWVLPPENWSRNQAGVRLRMEPGLGPVIQNLQGWNQPKGLSTYHPTKSARSQNRMCMWNFKSGVVQVCNQRSPIHVATRLFGYHGYQGAQQAPITLITAVRTQNLSIQEAPPPRNAAGTRSESGVDPGCEGEGGSPGRVTRACIPRCD